MRDIFSKRKRTSLGAISVATSGTPAFLKDGWGVLANGDSLVTTSAPSNPIFNFGIAFDPGNGAMYVTNSAPAAANILRGGIAVTNGALHVSTDGSGNNRIFIAGLLQVVTGPTWTDNEDGTATITVEFDDDCYCGIDYGTGTGDYDESALSYTNDDPNDPGGPLLSTTHSFTVPEQHVGDEVIADGTWYWRLAASTSSSSSMEYMAAEQDDVITNPDVILLENDTDTLLLETGDFLLAEGSVDVKITDMTAASSLADANVIVGVQSGTTKKFALSDLKAYING